MSVERKLSATRRTVIRKRVNQLRREGQLPAVLYGRNVDPQPIQVNAREAARVLRNVSGSELIDLAIDGQTYKVLLQDSQRNPLRRGEYVHIDFYAVDMSRRIKVHVPIRLVGTAPAVQSFQGVLVRGVSELEVECLPGDLI